MTTRPPSEHTGRHPDAAQHVMSMETESIAQQQRGFTFIEGAGELAGDLQVPDYPEVSAGYGDIYHGTWTSPRGEQVEVAIKELKTLIPKDKQTDPEALKMRRDMIFQAACGLEHLHAQNPPICHADIKPENVLINDFYSAVLSDFGLSRVLEDFGWASGFTTSERVKGTLNYMASELFTAEKPKVTLETDVYAFGGLILTVSKRSQGVGTPPEKKAAQVMSGKAPFSDLRESAILFRVISNQPPRQEDHPDLVPTDPLWSLMRQCWNMIPEMRPSIREVLRELWKDICKEEFDLWSRPGLPLAPHSDDTSSPDMDLD
ncbi:hypothetical protein FS837_001264, partial [Tulasnella sp. UAMH 9824]